MRLDGPLPFHGYVVWLTSEQGGRAPAAAASGDDPVAPAPNLLAEQRGPAQDLGFDGTGAGNSSIGTRASPRQAHLDRYLVPSSLRTHGAEW